MIGPSRLPPIDRLQPADLTWPAPSGALRQFVARLINIEPRLTSSGLAWGVLGFRSSTVGTLRSPPFATYWALCPDLEVGRLYRVVGTVEFRDRIPAIRLLEVQGSHLRVARAPSIPSNDIEHPQG